MGTRSISEVVQPLAFVDGSIFESDPTSVNAAIFIWLLMLHSEVLVGVNAKVLIIHASVEAIVLELRVLVSKLVLVHVVSSHDGGTVVFVDVLFEGRGIALDLSSLDLLRVVGAIAAVIGTTSHFIN